VTQKQEESPSVIYTVGTSNRSLEEFLRLLQSYGIKQVLDVRSFPVSRRFPHFSRENLEKALSKANVAYFWLGKELGGYRKGGYEAFMESEVFQQGLLKLIELARQEISAIMCAERFPWRCHRRFISQKLEERGFEVRHIIEEGRIWIPRRSPRMKLMF